MADLDDDAIIVNLEGEGDGAIKKIDAGGETEDPIKDLKGQFETLKGTVAQTRQTNHHLSQQLTARDQELTTLRKEVVTSQIDTVTSGLQAAEAEAASAEKDYVAAAEAGDFAAQARAQRKMAAAETKIGRLKEAEEDLKDQTPTTKREARQEPRQAQQDPVEEMASRMAPRAAAWIRAHRDHVTDDAKNREMMKTHHRALADGLAEGGDEYFARLDAMASGATEKRTEKHQQTEGDNQQQTTGRRPSSAAAPAGGSSGGMNGGGVEVKLSRREAEAATDGTHVWNYDDPKGKFKKGEVIGVSEFARRKLQMQKEGHYDRSFTES